MQPVQQRPAAAYPLEVTGSLVPVSNGRYLAERIPGSELTILPAGHFAWEEIPDQFAALITDSVTEAKNQTSQ